MCRPILAFLLLTTSLGWAGDQDEALSLRKAGEIRSLENILQTALTLYPQGRVLEAELERNANRYEYEIEIITVNGIVRELEFDAHDGRLLSDEEDD